MRRCLIAILVVPLFLASCGGGSSPTGPTGNNSACVIAVPQLAMNVTATAGSTAIPVTAGATCAWTVTSSQPWLTITTGTGATGAGTVNFSVAENTGAQRVANVTIGGVVIVVTQAAAPPPIAWVLPAIPAGVVGTAYVVNIATATGGTGSFHYQLDTFGGFPPIGLILAPNGVLSGTPTIAGAASFRACAVDTSERQLCQAIGINVTAAPVTTVGAANGNWGGSIILQVGCTQPLPQNYPWTGTIRTAANGGTELLVSVPTALVFNEVHPVTITGQRITFSIDFGVILNFVGDANADFTAINGTFTGTNCQIPPVVVIPSGSWNGTRR